LEGRLLGPLDGPTFAGHFKGTDASYGSYYWDDLEGELTYSPAELHLERTRARRGQSSADLELALDLDNWGFAPDSQWTFDVNLVRIDTDDLQKNAGHVLRRARRFDRTISFEGNSRSTGI